MPDLTVPENFPALSIAIDGPAASGKGTLAKRVAEHFGWQYLDTGKLYRAVGYTVLTNHPELLLDKNGDGTLTQHAVGACNELNTTSLQGAHLDSEEVGRAASIVSAIPEVRDALLSLQREIASSPNGAVLDGRDIGTVVWPQAPIKFFITASLEARTNRRYKQLQKQDDSVIREAILQDLQQRDARDAGRSIAPMKPADDAYSIDTTELNMQQVFDRVVGIILSYTSG